MDKKISLYSLDEKSLRKIIDNYTMYCERQSNGFGYYYSDNYIYKFSNIEKSRCNKDDYEFLVIARWVFHIRFD